MQAQASYKFCTAFCRFHVCQNPLCTYAHSVEQFRGLFAEIEGMPIGLKLNYIIDHQVPVFLHNLMAYPIHSELLSQMNLVHDKAFTTFCWHPECPQILCTYAHSVDQLRTPNPMHWGKKLWYIIQTGIPVYLHNLIGMRISTDFLSKMNLVHETAFTEFCMNENCNMEFCLKAHNFDQLRVPADCDNKFEYIVENEIPVFTHILEREDIPQEFFSWFNLDLDLELNCELYDLEQNSFLVSDEPDSHWSDDFWVVA